jgi:hypothetical protein
MRLRLDFFELVGAERRLKLEPGLNVIAGPIATGKTTLLRCIRALLAGGITNFPLETRQTVQSLAGRLVIGNSEYDVIRPFVSTANAKVEVAGDAEAERLPAYQGPNPADRTYRDWLLHKLNLPEVRVPRSPSRSESELSPVTVNDYLMYCYLQQEEIDKSVFGHNDYFKNVKRMAVFDIVYGRYDAELAGLREQLREVSSELRRWRNWFQTIDEFLEGTPVENRAAIERRIRETEAELKTIEMRSVNVAEETVEKTDSTELRDDLRQTEEMFATVRSTVESEATGAEQKERLIAQLRTQSARLTKAIVADEYLLDFDFVMCPRCGSEVSADRSTDDNCYLCLQRPHTRSVGRKELAREQDRLEQQIIETQDLVRTHRERERDLRAELRVLESRQSELARELDFRTRSYVSNRASAIAKEARIRTELRERLKRLQDYLSLFARQEGVVAKISQLEEEERKLEAIVDADSSSATNFEEHFRHLEEQFRDALERFEVPHFLNAGYTGIDRKTYKPIIEGRPFDQLQSPGFVTLVNIAHALAHQVTAIQHDLALPNILLIDGVSNNLGTEGRDRERVDAVYDYLIEIGAEYGDRLQIIVADNTVQTSAADCVRILLSEEDKLIPIYRLS